jgi:hypothetical protein
VKNFLLYFVGVEMMPMLQEVYNEGSSQAQYPHVEDALQNVKLITESGKITEN